MKFLNSKSTHLVGVDISTTAVKIVELARDKGRYTLKSYGIEPIEPGWVVDRVVVNPEMVAEALATLVRRLKISTKDAATAMAGNSVITKIIEMDSRLNDTEREAQIRLDAEQYIPYAINDVSLDFDVVGPSETPNMVQVALAAARTEDVERRLEALRMAGLNPKVVDVEYYAMERAFGLIQQGLGGAESVALVDIGHTQSMLYIAKDEKFIFDRANGFGGGQLTDSIQARYSLSYQDATLAKRNLTLPDDYRTEIAMPFMETAVQNITRALQFYLSTSQNASVDNILLAGGTAAIPGLAEMVRERMGGAVEIANPFKNMHLGGGINHDQLNMDAPGLMVACGLALRSFD